MDVLFLRFKVYAFFRPPFWYLIAMRRVTSYLLFVFKPFGMLVMREAETCSLAQVLSKPLKGLRVSKLAL